MAQLSQSACGRADLHVHTTASDGIATPAEVVHLAVQAGLEAIAIADHDSVDAISGALAAARDQELRIIPAVEINTDYHAGEAHILGYFIRPEDQWFRGFLAQQRATRELRAQRILQRLAGLGYPIDWQRVLATAAGAVITRPHIARVLVEEGHVANVAKALGGLLARSGPAYVQRGTLSPAEAVDAVRRAGGVPVLAHPGIGDHDVLIGELMNVGLAGIEAYHPQHSPVQREWYEKLAESLGLLATGGSDYHGSGGPGAAVIGACTVPVSIIGQLLARLPAAG